MVATVRIHTRELRAVLTVVVRAAVTVLGALLAALLDLLRTAVTGRERPRPAPPEPVVPPAESLVVLVHGFAGSPRCWVEAVRALRRPGVAVVTHAYSSWGTSVEELGAVLAERVDAWARRSGAREVTLVGHSLGGVVVAASLAGGRLAGTVTRVVTIAAPLRGSAWAHVFPFGVVRGLRHGSPVLRALAAAPRPAGVPWLAVASRADVIVPPPRASLDGAELVLVDGAGHCGLLEHPDVVARLTAVVEHAADVVPLRPCPVAA